MKRRQTNKAMKGNELTIDFGGPFHGQNKPVHTDIFQRVKSEMLKRKERQVLRRKPFEYERLQKSLQGKLKQKDFNRQQQTDQLVMLEKCQNFFQMRKSKSKHNTSTPKLRKSTYSKTFARPQTTATNISRTASSSLMVQLQGVMDDCGHQQRQVKEHMGLFSFYCRMLNKRLDGIKHKIQKKQRVI